MKSIVEGIGVAFKNKMRFSGVLSSGVSVTEHGDDFREVVNGFFGHNASRLIFPKVKPNFTAKFDNLERFERARASFENGSSIYCPVVNDWESMRARASAYFPPELRAALRAPLLQGQQTVFGPGRLWVSIHARRGDLSLDDPRTIPDEYFYELISFVRRRFPRADLHLWSSTKWRGHKVPKWQAENFSGYVERNVTVHLDDKSILPVWADMARAHILIMSKSSFSSVPGYLNPHCVITAGAVRQPLEGWVSGMEPQRQGYEAQLNDCFSRAAAATGPILPGSPHEDART